MKSQEFQFGEAQYKIFSSTCAYLIKEWFVTFAILFNHKIIEDNLTPIEKI
ncbi:MAG TPA: hypothetical protein VK118_01930 [Tetragenococcus sp.]|nr:hypothetical protein [Tetragenococcus sp.]